MWAIVFLIVMAALIAIGWGALIAASRDDNRFGRDAGDGHDQYREPPK